METNPGCEVVVMQLGSPIDRFSFQQILYKIMHQQSSNQAKDPTKSLAPFPSVPVRKYTGYIICTEICLHTD